MSTTVVFPGFYFPPISYFALALHVGKLDITSNHHYRKQQLFNRMYIQTSQKIDKLSIPIQKSNLKTNLDKVSIENHENWQVQHWRALVSAYNNSPFFQYYSIDFEQFFQENVESLFKHSVAIIKKIVEVLELPIKVKVIGDDPENTFQVLHHFAKNKQAFFYKEASYIQVFRQFEPDLSIFDLLCNKGPESFVILEQSLNRKELEKYGI